MTTPVHTETCPRCEGRRWVPNLDGSRTCPVCQGSGRVPVPMRGITDPDEQDLDLDRARKLERIVDYCVAQLELISMHQFSLAQAQDLAREGLSQVRKMRNEL